MSEKFVLGIDFGTLSVRALLVNVANGFEAATAVYHYPHGVITGSLPVQSLPLSEGWALQHPRDYLDGFVAVVKEVLSISGIRPEQIIGLGTDFTSCTFFATTEDGLPLCLLAEYQNRPHSWPLLWKHHASQPQAERITQLARNRKEVWLKEHGGNVNAEWFFPKALQILEEAPDIYHAASRFVEGTDWIVWQLTGELCHNITAAGYKALWSEDLGYPSPEFFLEVHPEMADIVSEKIHPRIVKLGTRAGYLQQSWAALTGLPEGLPVAVGNLDGHSAVPAASVVEAGEMAMIMGTSNTHLLLSDYQKDIPGICGWMKNGIVDGLIGYEAGQRCVGDHFAWFVKNCVPQQCFDTASAAGLDIYQYLNRAASAIEPGESGMLALDWWDGNRNILSNGDLTGVWLGMNLATDAIGMYRSLIEATAFGSKVIVDQYEKHGIPIHRIVAVGGLAVRNPLLLQIYSDVLGKTIELTTSQLHSALGAALQAAVAAGVEQGGYLTIQQAVKAMVKMKTEIYHPDAVHHEIYQRLFQEFRQLHDVLGGEYRDMFKRLNTIKQMARRERNEF